MTDIHNIPVELYRFVVTSLDPVNPNDRQALSSLCLTSRNWRCEATTILYSKIMLQTVDQHVDFFTTIIIIPELAVLVHEYTHSLLALGTSVLLTGKKNLHQRQIFIRLLPRALQSMVNLKLLSFEDHDSTSAARDILFQAPFKLTELRWTRTHTSQEDDLISLLHCQGSLQKLTVQGWGRTVPPSSLSLKLLSDLTGDHCAMECFLPGRNISRLTWIPECLLSDFWGEQDFLADSLEKLTFLRMEATKLRKRYGPERARLRCVSPFLKNVQTLELVDFLVCFLFYPWGVFGILMRLFKKGEEECLRDLPSLSQLVIQGAPTYGPPTYGLPLDQHDSFTQNIFREVSTLQTVIMLGSEGSDLPARMWRRAEILVA
jgi:hypothetical protein